MTRILGLGDNTIDTYVDAGIQFPGGNAVNVAAMTARLGADAAYLGCVGDDEGGRLISSSLVTEGVDISRVRIRAGGNARAFVGHVHGDRQFIGSRPGVRADYRWEPADFAYIATFDHVHTSIYSDLGNALPQIAANAASLSLDVSDRWDHAYLHQVLPFVRFLFLSAAEMSESDARNLARLCLVDRPEAVILTRGSDGALGMDANGTVIQRALPTTVVDTMGAGDGFISGFLMAALEGGSLDSAMSMGAEYAAKACTWQGGYGHGMPWVGDAEALRAIAAR